MYLVPVDEKEVEKIIDCAKAKGDESTHPKLVKAAKKYIVLPLTYRFNLSRKIGKCPE